MRLILVLLFTFVSLALVMFWPDPLPPQSEEVRARPGMTHVEAAALNIRQRDHRRRVEIEHWVRVGGVVVIIIGATWIGFRLGRRVG